MIDLAHVETVDAVERSPNVIDGSAEHAPAHIQGPVRHPVHLSRLVQGRALDGHLDFSNGGVERRFYQIFGLGCFGVGEALLAGVLEASVGAESHDFFRRAFRCHGGNARRHEDRGQPGRRGFLIVSIMSHHRCVANSYFLAIYLFMYFVEFMSVTQPELIKGGRIYNFMTMCRWLFFFLLKLEEN